MAAQVDDLTPATEFLHGSESVVYPDAGYRGIEQRIEIKGRENESRVTMCPGKRRVLPGTPEARMDDFVETAKANFCAKVEHPFRVIKRQFVTQKTWPWACSLTVHA